MNNYRSRPIACSLMAAAFLSVAMPLSMLAQMGNDNPTGVSGVFNGNVSTAGSYDPYTGNATRTVTDITVAGAVGTYPLAFTRMMNSRFNPSAGSVEFGASGSWRHSYQWSIDPITIQDSGPHRWYVMPGTYNVNYPDGRRVGFYSQPGGDSYFRGFGGVSDRFQQLHSDADSDVYLLLPDGGKVWFSVTISRDGDDFGPVTSTFEFELQGIIDPYGQVTTVGYAADGSLSITEPAGRWLKLFYISTPWNGDVVIDRVVSSDGRSVKYNYGGYQPAGATLYTYLGNVQYLDTNGASYAQAIYAYQQSNINPDGRMLLYWAIDPMYAGRMWAIGYTFLPGASGGVYGQVQSENYLDPRTGTVGQVVSSLSVSGNSRTETRGDGPSRTFNYSGGKLVSYTDFKNQTSSISYDGNGFISAYTDARGKTTTTAREGIIGAVSVLTHPDAEHSTQGNSYWYSNGGPYYVQIRGDERGHNTYFSRDPNNFQLTRIDYPDYPNGGYETFTYNNFGQVLTHRMTSGGTESRSYDGRGMMWASTNPDGTTYYFYDAQDRLEHVVDPRGKTTWLQYNARGQVTRVTHIDGSYVQYGYNVDGTLAWTADENHPGAETDANQRTRYTYDDYRRVVSVTNPLNETASLIYAQDWANAYNQTTTNVKGAFSPMGKQIHFAYDENWQRTVTRVPPGSDPNDAWIFYGYDPAGNLTWTQDPRGYATTFGYDERNRRTSMTNALNQTTSWQYDATNNLIRETRADQSYRSATYDSMNRVIDTYGFANEHTKYTRDLAGNVYEMIDANNATYRFSYDELNRKLSATYPADASANTRTETWHYDVGGNIDLYKNPAGQYRHLFYDDRNRMYEAWWDNGAAPEVVIAYDWASRITSIVTNTPQVTAETIVTFGYDAANRRIREDQTLAGYPTRRIETPRDADGHRSGLTASTNGHLDYGLYFDYNQRNELQHIQGGDHSAFATYTRDANGNVLNRRLDWLYANGANFAYDQLNRMTEIDQGDAGQIFSVNHYQYDSLGREVATWRDEQGSKGEHFGYDAMGQLTSVAYNADQVWTGTPFNATRNVNYNVDPLKRISVTENGTPTGYAASAMNQYTNVGGAPVGYDGNFNLNFFGGATASYNAQSQLTAVNNGNGAQFTYDGLGRCVRRIVNNVPRLFTYDGWNPILEWDGSGNWLAWTIYGAKPDEVLARYSATYGPLIYKQDKQGNVAFILDGANRVIEKYTYDAFGQPTVVSWNYSSGTWDAPRNASAFDNRFMFQGREWIPELNLYDFRNRFYFPLIGGFLQKDPLGFGGGDANLFRFCGGDPVNGSDPSGLTPIIVTGTPIYDNEGKDSGPALGGNGLGILGGGGDVSARGGEGGESVSIYSGYTPTGSHIPQSRTARWNGSSWGISYHDYVYGTQSLGNFVLVGGLGGEGGVQFISTSTPLGHAIELGTRALDAVAAEAKNKGVEVGGVFFSNGKMSKEYGTEGSITIRLLPGAIGTFHIHHLVGPAPYEFSPFDEFNFLYKRPDWVHLIGILDGEPGKFTIRAYIPGEDGGLSFIRDNRGH